MKERIVILLLLSLFLSCGERGLKEVNSFDTTSNEYRIGIYHTLDGLYNELNLLKTMYPKNVELFELGKSSNYGKTIPLLRIRIGDNNKRENYLFVSGTHGDEGAPVEALIYTIQKVLENKSDFEKGESFNLDFIVIHNPDGYLENERKNNSGVDLNRNFPISKTEQKYENENKVIIKHINKVPYKMSLFFHSANEEKYENMIRRPIEFLKLGKSGLTKEMNESLDKLIEIIKKSNSEIVNSKNWTVSSYEVPKPGIASDWCVSGGLTEDYKNFVKQECINSHPSLTIELCYPKQPTEKKKLDLEYEEMYTMVRAIINKF